MDYRISNITVDLATSNNFGIVKAVQGDMRTRWVHITLLDNQIEYDVGKVYPVLRGTKPDGKTIFNKCTVSEDKKIIVELTEQILAEPGMSVYEIALYATPVDLLDDKEVITSFPFSVFVSKSAFDPDIVTSSDEFTAIADVMGDAAFLKECLDDIAISRDAAKDSELKAKDSENKSKVSEINAKDSENKAKTSEINAKDSENKSKTSEINAAASAATATTKATESSNSATLSRSWAVGDTNTRSGEATNNSKYYSEQSKKYADSWKGSLLPKGTILFSQLPTSNNIAGHMYNISNAFITDERFKDGSGFSYPAGTNVYWTVDEKWDCLSGAITMELTLAEYNALSEEQKMNGTIYYISDADNSIPLVDETFDGLMSHLDKIKIDGIENGATRVLVDSALSTTSQNAVQNKVVATAITANISTHNSSTTSHNDIRELISILTTRLNTLADSDDTTLDQLSEIVSYIKSNRSLIENITTNKVNVSDIVNDLNSTATNKVLSANQGNVLKELITSLTSTVNNKVDKVSGKGLSTNDFTTEEKNKLASITNNANNYNLPVASPENLGGVKTGYTQNGKKYSVQLDNEKMYVEVPWHDTTYSIATASANGLMSFNDKYKLDGIDMGANNYNHPATHPAAMIEQDEVHRFVSDSDKQTWNGKADANHTHGYLPLSGGAMTGPIDMQRNELRIGGLAKITSAGGHDMRFTVNDGTNALQLLLQGLGNVRQFFPSVDGGCNLGISVCRWKDIYAANAVISTSDERLKDNIHTLDNTLTKAFIMGLNPISYTMTDGDSGRRHYGFGAQSVEKLMDEIGISSMDFAGFIKSPVEVPVEVEEEIDDENGQKIRQKKIVYQTIEGKYRYGLRYEEFIAPLTKVVQIQEETICKQGKMIQELSNRLETLERYIDTVGNPHV